MPKHCFLNGELDCTEKCRAAFRVDGDHEVHCELLSLSAAATDFFDMARLWIETFQGIRTNGHGHPRPPSDPGDAGEG
ncbi:MAG: hypothetical protein RL885_11735 [Planctomycetota bacterium]